MSGSKFPIAQFVFGTLLFIVLLLVASGCSREPDRLSSIGRMHLSFEDPERDNWSGDGARPIQATVWYPASPEIESQEWKVGVFRFGHTALNATFLDEEKRPLIIVSHGTGGSAAQLSWLSEQLVDAGFLVAGANHHGNTATEDRQWPAGYVQPWERSRDMSVLIDRLFDHPDIGPRIDQQRVGAAGFSLGGYSVLGLVGVQLPSFEAWLGRCRERPEAHACRLPPEANFAFEDVEIMRQENSSFQAGMRRGGHSFRDSRVSAIYAIAPALVSLLAEDERTGRDQEIRVVLAEKDNQIGLPETVEAVERVMPNASLLVIEAAGHYEFLAPCTLRGKLFLRMLCRGPSGVDRRDVHSRVGNDAIVYFNSMLNDRKP